MDRSQLDSLAEAVLAGQQRPVARALSMVEDGHPESHELLHRLYDPARASTTVGVTGQPGAGKSTLANGLIDHWRSEGKRVGVVCVDPSSPFSGGALLGDRLRMQSHATDPEVFIRSMGSRGHLGGLAGASRDAGEVLAAAGYDPVLLETVGVGQGEVEVAAIADVTLLVLVPGLGDDVQTMKAGIMEIGDIIVLNKADRPGIDQLETTVRTSFEMMGEGAQPPPVVRCSAQTGEGIGELAGLVAEAASGAGPRPERALRRARLMLDRILEEKGLEIAEQLLAHQYGGREEALRLVMEGGETPYGIGRSLRAAAMEMLE